MPENTVFFRNRIFPPSFVSILAKYFWIPLFHGWGCKFLHQTFRRFRWPNKSKSKFSSLSLELMNNHQTETNNRVDMVGTIHDDLLTQWRHIPISQFRANIHLIPSNSNYLWSSEVFKNQSIKSQTFTYFYLSIQSYIYQVL